MATKTDGEANAYTFQWKIENVSQSWWLPTGQRIESPAFVADGLEGTKWSLWFYPNGDNNDDFVNIYLHTEEDCSGLYDIEANYQLLGENSSILKREKGTLDFETGQTSMSLFLEERQYIFGADREKFLPEDTLTVRCSLGKVEKEWGGEGLVKSKHLYAQTVFKVIRKSFDWKIDKFRTFQPAESKKFKIDLIEFDLVLNRQFDKSFDVNIISFDHCVKYISLDTWITDSEGEKISCGINRYFVGDDFKKGVPSRMLTFSPQFYENRNRYFPNDVLRLYFDVVLSTVAHSDCRDYSVKSAGQEKYENMAALIEDLKSMLNDGILSDTELRTSTQTFPAHKNILSARSPVFRRMFSNDMAEKSSGHVEITDLEDDTVRRMLLYVYTSSLEDLQYESASKLYEAADKYEIMPLKSKCSSFLKDNLCLTKACDVLILADQHQDNDLKSTVQDYILQHGEVFKSPEWKHFMDTNLKLAADIMYRKVIFDVS